MIIAISPNRILPPLVFDEKYIAELKKSVPELPAAKIERYISKLGLSEYDAILLSSEKEIAAYFDELIIYNNHYKAAANWVIGPLRTYLHDTGTPAKDFKVQPKILAELIELIDAGKLKLFNCSTAGFPELIKNPLLSAEHVANSLQVLIDTDADDLSLLIEEVLKNYPDKVKEYQNGKKGVLGLFMGDLMKKTKGKINPQVASKLVIEKLESIS